VQFRNLLFRPIGGCPRLGKQGNSRIVCPFAEELLIRPGTREQIRRLVEKEISQLKQLARNVVRDWLNLNAEYQFRKLLLLSRACIAKDSIHLDPQSSRLPTEAALRIPGHIQELFRCKSLEVGLIGMDFNVGLGAAVQQAGSAGVASQNMNEEWQPAT